jgi:hypothetical protein
VIVVIPVKVESLNVADALTLSQERTPFASALKKCPVPTGATEGKV